MADEHENKSSLQGRGRDIMRGTSENNDLSPSQNEAGWLPVTSEEGQESPYFEDDNDLMRWMEADMEENRPTTTPQKRLITQANLDTGQLYPDPDFDAIFGLEESLEEEPAAPPAPASTRLPETQTLDDIFSEQDPDFDDLFADVIPVETQPAALPLPPSDDLFADVMHADGVPGFSEERSEYNHNDYPPTDDGWDFDPSEEDLFAEPEPIKSSIFVNQPIMPDEPTMRIPYEDMEAEDSGWEDDSRDTLHMPLQPNLSSRDPFQEDEVDTREVPEEIIEAFAEEPLTVSEEQPYGDATEILNQRFFEDDDDSPDAQATFNLLGDMTGELPVGEEDYLELPPVWEEDLDLSQEAVETRLAPLESLAKSAADESAETGYYAPPMRDTQLSEATAILNQRFFEDDDDSADVQATFSLLDEMAGELGSDDAGFLDDQPMPPSWLEEEGDEFEALAEPEVTQSPASDAELFVAMLEEEASQAELPPAEVATEIPLPPLELEETLPTHRVGMSTTEQRAVNAALEEPLDLPATDNKAPITSEPFALSPAPSEDVISLATPLVTPSYEEAVPLGESDTRQVDLRSSVIRRSDGIPEQETLPAGQEPTMIAEPITDTGGGTEEVENIEPELPAEATRSVAVIDDPSSLPDPFAQKGQDRQAAKEIFRPSPTTSDTSLLGLFVDDNRLRDLYEQIEAMQEDVVQNVRGERGNSDTYQEELLLASNLLMTSRENYDEARAIVYRVRADLNRERRVEADIIRFRPILTATYFVILVAWVILMLLAQSFISLSEAVGAAWIGYGYYCAMMGLAGAWLSGVYTLYLETIINQDFDPIRVNKYIFNPVFGMIAGFMVYLISLATSATLLSNVNAVETVGLSPMTLVLAAGVGIYQNSIFEMFNARRGVTSNAAPRTSNSRERQG